MPAIKAMTVCRRRPNAGAATERPSIDTLFVIGNGFDLWQGLSTSYSAFQDYYIRHRDEIMRHLRIRMHDFIDERGATVKVSDVEIVYGDPFDPGELNADFWGAFETSLQDIDAERLNLFFDKDKSGLRQMNRTIRNAKRILQTAFCDWIAALSIAEEDAGFHFGDNCLFINFNYTDTLLKRFSVRAEQEYHIHGEATDRDSIIFGHSLHPQLPEEQLYRFGGRFRGLYYVDKLLYETDKHVEDNIQLLCMFLAAHGVMCEEISDIFVLGHSMSPPDIEYFAFLMRATAKNAVGQRKDKQDNIVVDETDELMKHLQYTIDHVGYGLAEDVIQPEYVQAARRKYEIEQATRSQAMERDFMRMLTRGIRRKKLANALSNYVPPVRKADAKWHISYHGEQSKKQAETVMAALNCNNYQLYPTIDACVERFKNG